MELVKEKRYRYLAKGDMVYGRTSSKTVEKLKGKMGINQQVSYKLGFLTLSLLSKRLFQEFLTHTFDSLPVGKF